MHPETDEAAEGASGSDGAWEPWLADFERSSEVGRLRVVLDDLWRFPFDTQRGLHSERWDRLFARLLELTDHADAGVRELADHYARIVTGEERDFETARRRIAALLPAWVRRIERGELSLLHCIGELAHVERTDVGPQEAVERWIEEIATTPAQTLAARIGYFEGRGASPNGAYSVASLVDHFDHADAMVRAYAARALGNHYTGSAQVDDPAREPLPDFLAKLTAKEIERPGIAGPFLSNWYDHALGHFEEHSGVDLRDWLITILVKRKQPEPNLHPCSNGIDFFAHEIFGSSPQHVRRLLDLGHDALAVEAATEIDEPIDEMLPLLVELADRPDPEVCRRAAWHLAAEYRQHHPAGAARGFVRRQRLKSGDDLWILLSEGPEGTRQAYSATMFPTGRQSFTEEEAAAAVDATLPTTIRGELQPFGMPGDGAHPGLWIHGRSANARYSSGAILEFRGDVGSRRWERIRIIWHGAPGAWRPEGPE